jgi:DNA-binding NarL/FixJ family response regulator
MINKQNEIIGHIYEASHNPKHWPVALEFIAKVTQSDAAALMYRDNEITRVGGAFWYNHSQESIEAYNSVGDDPNFPLIANNTSIGTARTVDNIVPDRKELEKIYGNYLQKILIPNDYLYIAGMVLFNDSVKTVGVGLQRRGGSGPWPSEELMQPLTELAPHLQRAMLIHREFSRLKAREQALQSGIDKLLIGHILVDQSMSVVYSNPSADKILKEHPALRCREGKLCAYRSEDTERIYNAVQTAILAQDDDDSNQCSTALGLTHHDVTTTLPLLVTPATGSGVGDEQNMISSHVAIIISDPEHNQPVPPEALVNTYGLTKTQAKVAIAIANGLTSPEIADLLRVKQSTIKTHTKAIFQKVGVNRQAELVKVLLTGPFRVNY